MSSLSPLESSCPFIIDGEALLQCPAELQKAVDFIGSDPESAQLFQKAASQEIPLKIKFQSDLLNTEFARYCYGNNTIVLSSKLQDRSIDQIVPYLVFELNNARKSSQFKEIDEKSADAGIEETVRRVEQCEYDSDLETNRLIQKWIAEGKLPKTAAFSRVLPNFRDHYLYQQASGHSQQIADRYDVRFSSCYRGTWKVIPSQDEIPLLKFLLELKMLKAHGTAEESKLAEVQLEKLVDRAKSIVAKKPDSLAARNFLENVLYALQTE
ncbi:MAG: hypothetical protein JSR39_03045 [Verrucomicrobia bacterium]|nr:hypothetical protein [Verrucomicrobiota bacterium]